MMIYMIVVVEEYLNNVIGQHYALYEQQYSTAYHIYIYLS